jgi:hypothetical protein
MHLMSITSRPQSRLAHGPDCCYWSAPIWYTSGYIRGPAFDLHPVSVQPEGYSAPDFSGLSWLCSHSKGDKSPKELCGLNQLYSSLHFSKCTRRSAMF